MKKKIFIIIITAALLTIIFSGLVKAAPQTMNITSPAFEAGKSIPDKYTCDGSNSIPTLNISNVPDNTKSLAIIVDDPDAPGGVFTHWIAWNIDPTTEEISEDMTSGIVNGKNSAGKNGFVGPCPPMGTHRYYFKVYALDGKLNLDVSATKTDLETAMLGHIIGQGELMGKYSRSGNK